VPPAPPQTCRSASVFAHSSTLGQDARPKVSRPGLRATECPRPGSLVCPAQRRDGSAEWTSSGRYFTDGRAADAPRSALRLEYFIQIGTDVDICPDRSRIPPSLGRPDRLARRQPQPWLVRTFRELARRCDDDHIWDVWRAKVAVAANAAAHVNLSRTGSRLVSGS